MGSITWEISEICNLNCKHCIVDNISYSKDLTIEENKKIVDILTSENVSNITFPTKEPFMYKDFIELLKYCKLSKIDTNIVTNGTLLNKEIIEFLYSQMSVKMISISLEGLSTETNDIIRGKGTFSKVIENLDILKKFNAERKNRILVTLQLNLTPFNLLEIGELFNFACKYDIYQISIGTIEINGAAKSNDEVVVRDRNVLSQRVEEIVKKYSELQNKNFIINFKHPFPQELIYYNTIYNANIFNCIPKCTVYSGKVAVMQNGELNACSLLLDEPMFTKQDVVVGNILEDGLRGSYKIFDDEYLNSYKNNDICKNCYFRDSCKLCLLCTKNESRMDTVLKECSKFKVKLEELLHDIFLGKVYIKLRDCVIVNKIDDRYIFKKRYTEGLEKILEINNFDDNLLSNIMLDFGFKLNSETLYNIEHLKQLLYNDLISIVD